MNQCRSLFISMIMICVCSCARNEDVSDLVSNASSDWSTRVEARVNGFEISSLEDALNSLKLNRQVAVVSSMLSEIELRVSSQDLTIPQTTILGTISSCEMTPGSTVIICDAGPLDLSSRS